MKMLSKNMKVLISEEEIQNKIKELADKLNSHYKNEEVCVICVLKGAVMLAVDLVKHLKTPIKMEFIRLSSYMGSTSSSGKVHAIDTELPDLNGKNILIVEDIVDTGLTAKFLTDFIKSKYKPKSLAFCSLLDKKIARQTDISTDYCCFEVDDKFVVGYGLDYDEYYRNLPYVAYIENQK